jgi:hypothetical protein
MILSLPAAPLFLLTHFWQEPGNIASPTILPLATPSGFSPHTTVLKKQNNDLAIDLSK